MTSISPKELQNILKKDSNEHIVIDVRSDGEHKLSHISGVKNIPLESLENHLDELSAYKEIFVHCQSGNRSTSACKKLKDLGLTNVINVEGGINEWKSLNLPVNEKPGAIPLMRQVFITAGLLILIGYLFSLLYPAAIFLSVFVGAGLLFAGITGHCTMTKILAKMPWNL